MPAEVVLPPALPVGGTVALVCPSSPTSAATVERVATFWRDLGHEVRVGRHVLRAEAGYLAGTSAERADDLNWALAADDIDLIVPIMGGKGASHLLPLLDTDAFRARPKLFVGQSDSSLLALALHAASGVVTFHGPTGMNVGRMPDYTRRAMNDALTRSAPLGELPRDGEWRTLRGTGKVTGRLLGGHLRTIQALVGTRYAPDWDGAILFLEEIDCELHDVDAALTHLRLAGILDQVAALVFGRPVNVVERWKPSEETLEELLLRVTAGLELPIVANADLGHTDETLTLPVGLDATVDCERAAIAIAATATATN